MRTTSDSPDYQEDGMTVETDHGVTPARPARRDLTWKRRLDPMQPLTLGALSAALDELREAGVPADTGIQVAADCVYAWAHEDITE
jgi:hypothetical protein